MLGDERLQLADELGVPAELELGVDPLLDRGEAQLLEAGDLALGEGVVGEVGQRLAAPERERLGERAGGRLRVVSVPSGRRGARSGRGRALRARRGAGTRACASPAARGRGACAGWRRRPGAPSLRSSAPARPRGRRSACRWRRPRSHAGAGSRAACAACGRPEPASGRRHAPPRGRAGESRAGGTTAPSFRPDHGNTAVSRGQGASLFSGSLARAAVATLGRRRRVVVMQAATTQRGIGKGP